MSDDTPEEFLASISISQPARQVEDGGVSATEFLSSLEEKDSRPPAKLLSPKGYIRDILSMADPLESRANSAGIYNVFEDSGLRTLILCSLLDLRTIPGRLGDDAIDAYGHRYELKTVNVRKSDGVRRSAYPGISTEHTLNEAIIERYRRTTAWVIGIFDGHTPKEVWQVPSAALEATYQNWINLIRVRRDTLNNPKIPFQTVRAQGFCVYMEGQERPTLV